MHVFLVQNNDIHLYSILQSSTLIHPTVLPSDTASNSHVSFLVSHGRDRLSGQTTGHDCQNVVYKQSWVAHSIRIYHKKALVGFFYLFEVSSQAFNKAHKLVPSLCIVGVLVELVRSVSYSEAGTSRTATGVGCSFSIDRRPQLSQRSSSSCWGAKEAD